VIGLGSDLIDIRRIENTLSKFGDRFKKRIFTENEIKKCERRKESAACYAKRFAAKEAAAKALGTGFRKSVYWRDIEVINNKSGKPELFLHNGARAIFEKLLPQNTIGQIDLSITDEYPYAQATVIITSLD